MHSRDIIRAARHLIEMRGEGALATALARSRILAHSRSGLLWAAIADAVRAIEADGTGAPAAAPRDGGRDGTRRLTVTS